MKFIGGPFEGEHDVGAGAAQVVFPVVDAQGHISTEYYQRMATNPDILYWLPPEEWMP